MAGSAPSEVHTEAAINKQAVRITALLRNPSVARIVAQELRNLPGTMKVGQLASKLEPMCLSLEGRHGGWQTGTVALELIGSIVRGEFAETAIPVILRLKSNQLLEGTAA